MGNIVLLDDLTINKIAAGEVIERPASVVKELVENSIDAGATNISVEIKNGGISYIRITDNGKGFLPDDLEIAFERHATSKIRNADDLETVKSMGFRGEALASIAAISRIELVTKSKEHDIGYKVVVEGGNILSKEEIGCPQGTTITIENLFYNTPVRYKFLKKDFTESGYIEDVITRIALINPSISVRLINTGKPIIQSTGSGEIKDIVYSIYGKEIADNIINVNYFYDDMAITGVIGKPSISRSNRTNQMFFVNKRFVKDKTLSSAAEQGYKGMLTIGKYGFMILNVEIDPHKVDVNVHPAKLEVRFENESEVFKLVYHAIKESLFKSDFLGQSDEQRESMINQTSNNEPRSYGGFFKNIINNPKLDNKKEYEIHNNIIEDLYNTKTGINEVKELYSYSNNIDNTELNTNDDEIRINEKQEELIDSFHDKNIQANIEKNDVYNDEKSPIDEVEEQIRLMMSKGRTELKEKVNIEENLNIEENVNIEENIEKVETEISNSLKEAKERAKIIEDESKNEILKEKLIKKINCSNESKNSFEEMYIKTFGIKPKDNSELNDPKEEYILDQIAKTVENISMFTNSAVLLRPSYKIVGVSFNTYIILEIEDEMYILDQHAAHERILYERVKKNYYTNSGKESQLMLLPDVITLTHKEMGVLKDNISLFEQAGFVLEEFGENTIKLTGVPNICIDLDTKELFLETLDEINTVARTAKQEIEEKFIATIACKAAVKANMSLSIQEIDVLLQELLLLQNPFTCPHGRPTAIKMSRAEIEKKFSRR